MAVTQGECEGRERLKVLGGIAGYVKPATSGSLKWKTQCWKSVWNAADSPRFWTVVSLSGRNRTITYIFASHVSPCREDN